LTPHGTYVVLGDADMGRWVEPVYLFLLAPAVMSRLTSQRFVFFVASPNAADLNTLRDLIQEGKVRPVIDEVYPLSRMSEAMAHLETGHARGKVVIAVE
jgi:NADPH:quinone reductase-like Zn-dependent oxidoreductase